MSNLPGGRGVRLGPPGAEVVYEVYAAEINARALGAFLDANLRLENEAKQQATRNIWDWPRGKTPRDVVDTGGLRSSITARPDGNLAEWIHAVNVSYAAPVLLGYRVRTRGGFVNMPARNIYREPLNRLSANYARAFRRRGPSDAR